MPHLCPDILNMKHFSEGGCSCAKCRKQSKMHFPAAAPVASQEMRSAGTGRGKALDHDVACCSVPTSVRGLHVTCNTTEDVLPTRARTRLWEP